MSQIAVLVFEQPALGLLSETSEDQAKQAYKELEEMAKSEKVQIESATRSTECKHFDPEGTSF